MATFALIHGGSGSAWDWHLVVAALLEAGHDPVAVDLPSDDGSAGWAEYVDTVERLLPELRTVKQVVTLAGGHPDWEEYTAWRDRQVSADPRLANDAAPTPLDLAADDATRQLLAG